MRKKSGVATIGTNRTSPTLRLAKATLTLIPVMGMQNLIFILIPSQGTDIDYIIKFVWECYSTGVN